MKNTYVKPAMRYNESFTSIIPAVIGVGMSLGSALGAAASSSAALGGLAVGSALGAAAGTALAKKGSGIFANREYLPSLDEVNICL